jgi:cytochrome c biogenesis protein CcmG, thiol:disulfide interchange protein DsbE
MSEKQVNQGSGDGCAGCGLPQLRSGFLAFRARAWTSSIEVGAPARDFYAMTFDVRDIELADFKGHVPVINLWATRGVPCRNELPLLDTYYRLRKDGGLAIIALAIERLSNRLQRRSAIRSLEGCIVPTKRCAAYLHNSAIDRNGIVRYAKAGAFTLEVLNAILVRPFE